MSAHRLAALAIMAGMSACADMGADGPPFSRSGVTVGNFVPQDADPGQATYRAVDRMLDAAPGRLNPNGAMIVGTISDISNVDRSSVLGNLIADHARTRLVQRGMPVTELRLRSAVRMDRTQGEMVIARDPRAVLRPADASEVVTGTYAMGDSQVHVSLKIVAASTGRIVAAADFNLPRTMEMDALLGSRRVEAPAPSLPPEPPRGLF